MMSANVDPTPRQANGFVADAGESQGGGGAFVAIFILSLLIPIRPEIGGIRLDPYRALLVVTLIPFVAKLFSGKVGRVTSTDWLMIIFVVWTIFVYFYHHGAGKIPYALVTGAELLGGYLAGRVLIRSASDFRRFVRYFMIALLVMFPLAVFELNTFRMPLAELFGKFTTVIPKVMDPRFGLSRVQVSFPHAIHFGFFCSSMLANIYYLHKGRVLRMLPLMALLLSMAFMSLSSAAFLSILLQVLIIAWGAITGARWRLLVILTAIVYVALEILSNRGPIIILIETMTLNPQTAWWRVHIWNFGTQSVMNHPLFGIGLYDWVRPVWLAGTVDNYWLVIAMRFGFPGIILLLWAMGAHIYRVLRVKIPNDELRALRLGYAVSLIGILFTLATVHIWDAMNAFIMFYIGAGVFLYINPSNEAAVDENHIPDPQPDGGTRPFARNSGAGRGQPLPYSRSTFQGRARQKTPESNE